MLGSTRIQGGEFKTRLSQCLPTCLTSFVIPFVRLGHRRNNVLAFFGTDLHALNGLGKLTNGILPEDVTTTQQSSDGLVFDYKWDPTKAPNDPTSQNLDVARVNAFYVTNKYHDTLYKYGFTEKAFNFQDVNYSGKGAGSDWVEMQVQAPGTNNANFATPPECVPQQLPSMLCAHSY